MSRLEFGPQPKNMEVTDIATGHFVFQPVRGVKVSYQALNRAIEDAGYEIEGASITVAGTVRDDGRLETPDGQVFELTAANAAGERRVEELDPGSETTIEGAWQTTEAADVIVVSGEEEPGSEEP